MKFRGIIVAILILISSTLYADDFTLITEGDLANDVARGGSWGDFDGDGDQDVFTDILNLYQNNGDGTFTKIWPSSGTKYQYQSGVWTDYNNDGHLDLFVYRYGSNSLYTNNGDGTFSEITTGSIVEDEEDTTCASWSDYDRDGDLDIYLSNDKDGGASNSFYVNNGDGTFTKITSGVFPSGQNGGNHPAWADYDDDGHSDLFVSKYDGSNHLFHNNGDGTFTEITNDPVTSDWWSTGCAWGDYDNDGDLDLFVMTLVENSLYTNNGDGTFTPVTSGEIVNEYSSSRGCAWGDYDNDGDLDLIVSNGHPLYGLILFYANNGNGTFTKLTSGIVPNTASINGGITWSDYDNDGDLDLLATSDKNIHNQLFQNNGNSNHWINIQCIGTMSNTIALGTKLRAKATIWGKTTWQMREISDRTGMDEQNSLTVEFGLGDATVIDELIVEWPSGLVEEFMDVPADQFITIKENVSSNTIHVPGDYPTIQQAIDAAVDGNVVIVDSGTYVENIDFLGKAISVQSSEGPEATVIEGNQAGSVVTFQSCEGPDSILEGFTITGGSATEGGGIYCLFSEPTIRKNHISENIADFGGGIYCVATSPMMEIASNMIYSNYATVAGGGMFCYVSNPNIFNNTITQNGSVSGGGIYCDSFLSSICNTILWDDFPDEIAGGNPEATCCDVLGGWTGSGNIDMDPLFEEPSNGDYHLNWLSPCINRGTNMGLPVMDVDGDSVPCMGTCDMGADEFTGTHAFEADLFTLSEAVGGVINLDIHAGAGNGKQGYIILGSISGTAPGKSLPGGNAILPLNYDIVTEFVIENLNSPLFMNFLGITDPTGYGAAIFNTQGPMPPGIAGITISFAYALIAPPSWDFASNPINIDILP
ncbi:MAG: FG-GAP-like repeat-containing protein [Planctomycetota bacterium]|jgi:hypothetical protein